MEPFHFTIAGLTLDLTASVVLIKALVISRTKAADLSRARWPSKSDEEQLAGNPLARMLWEQSQGARWGLVLLFLGFALQIIGSLLAARLEIVTGLAGG